MQNLNICLIQTSLIWESKEDNFKAIEKQFFDTFKKGETDLILLPEMFNTGFSMNTTQLAEKMDGKSVDWLIHWAKKLECHIGGSLIIHEDGKDYNRFVIVSEKGVETFYDKRHLFRMADENKFFTAGEKQVIFELKGWKLMLQVCYDLRFPVFSRNKPTDNGKAYDAILYVANWPEKRAYIWKNLLQARAIENQAYVLGVNRVGSDANGITYSGDSMAIDPWGNILMQEEESLLIFKRINLKREVLNTIEKQFPVHLDADAFEL